MLSSARLTPRPNDLPGLSVFERGWLSSNNVLAHGDGEGAVLVDSGHCLHAEQTVALVRAGLDGEPLREVLNTHLHSDHCGGNALLQRTFGLPVRIPPGGWDAVQRWDEAALSFEPSGQVCERFSAQGLLNAGEVVWMAGRRWDVLPAPGHDPDSVMLFDAQHGILISADALWENGFGVVFPELDGDEAFDDVGKVLDQIGQLPVRWVIPGHGAPFGDVPAALQRARSRLDGFRRDPAKHLRYAGKVLVKYHLMEVQRQPLAALHQWAAATPLVNAIWQRLGRPGDGAGPLAWFNSTLDELLAQGALGLENGVVVNR